METKQENYSPRKLTWKKIGQRLASPELIRNQSKQKFIPKVKLIDGETNFFKKCKENGLERKINSKKQLDQVTKVGEYDHFQQSNESGILGSFKETKWLFQKTINHISQPNSPSNLKISSKKQIQAQKKKNSTLIKSHFQQNSSKIKEFREIFKKFRLDFLRQIEQIKNQFTDCLILLHQRYTTEIKQLKKNQLNTLPTDSFDFGPSKECACIKKQFKFYKRPSRDAQQTQRQHKEDDSFIKLIQNNIQCHQLSLKKEQQALKKHLLSNSMMYQEFSDIFKMKNEDWVTKNKQQSSEKAPMKHKSFQKIFETLSSLKSTMQEKAQAQVSRRQSQTSSQINGDNLGENDKHKKAVLKKLSRYTSYDHNKHNKVAKQI